MPASSPNENVREARVTRTVLLLVDVQNEVLDAKGSLGGDLRNVAAAILASIRQLVEWARRHQVPVVWVRMAYRAGYIDASRRVRESAGEMAGRMIDGTWGAQLCDGLGREDRDPVVIKKRPSAFFSTDLQFILRGLGAETLIVGGTSTNWAIESTCRDAETLDYRVTIAREATGARVGELHEPALRSIGSRYAEIKSVQDIVAKAP